MGFVLEHGGAGIGAGIVGFVQDLQVMGLRVPDLAEGHLAPALAAIDLVQARGQVQQV